MTRQEKIKFLTGIIQGKAAISDLTGSKHRFKFWHEAGAGLWKDDAGNVKSKDQIKIDVLTHHIFSLRSSVPIAKCEEDVDMTLWTPELIENNF